MHFKMQIPRAVAQAQDATNPGIDSVVYPPRTRSYEASIHRENHPHE